MRDGGNPESLGDLRHGASLAAPEQREIEAHDAGVFGAHAGGVGLDPPPDHDRPSDQVARVGRCRAPDPTFLELGDGGDQVAEGPAQAIQPADDQTVAAITQLAQRTVEIGPLTPRAGVGEHLLTARGAQGVELQPQARGVLRACVRIPDQHHPIVSHNHVSVVRIGLLEREAPARSALAAQPSRAILVQMTMMTIRRLMSLSFGVALIAIAEPLPDAWASYPGRPGEVVYQDSYSSFDTLNNGATEYECYLRAARPPAPGTTGRLMCQGSDAGFESGTTQFCPESGSGFSPDGQTVAFAGAEYQADGSSAPDQSNCGGSGYCPDAIILAGADGSAARLLRVPIADAEHPAFMPDGQTLVFAGKTGPGRPANLYTVGRAGTGLTRVTRDGGTDPAPCPNGSIVYLHRWDLYLLSSNLRTRHRLTYRGGTLPDCSQDNRAIAFLRRSNLYTISTTGRHLLRLSSGGVADGRPAFSPSGGEIAFTTTNVCTTHCGGHIPACTNLTDHLELIDLLGRLRRSYVIGSNLCSTDGDLGGDAPGDVAWRPLPATTPAP
jgi:hypothetical protein